MNRLKENFDENNLLEKLNNLDLAEEEFFYLKEKVSFFLNKEISVDISEFEIKIDFHSENYYFCIYYNYDLVHPIVEKIEK